MNSSSHTGVPATMCLSLALVVASVSALNLALPDLAATPCSPPTDFGNPQRSSPMRLQPGCIVATSI